MDLDSSGYYALAAPMALSFMLFERWRCARQGLPHSGFANSICNLMGGLGALLVGLVFGPVVVATYDAVFAHIALVDWGTNTVAVWLLAFVLGDLCYYLEHRGGHAIGALWALHSVHHQSETFDHTVAVRRSWFGDAFTLLFYLPLPLLGVPATPFFVLISAISFYSFFVHTRTYDFPSFGVLVTPSTHILHHSRNAPYSGHNFGAMLSIWDRLFGTYADPVPGIEPELGTPEGYRTHDGAMSQWVGVADLIAAVREAPDWRTAVAAVVWTPRPVAGPSHIVSEPRPEQRPAMSLLFTAICVGSAGLLWWRADHSLGVQIAGLAALLGAIVVLGALLDGRWQPAWPFSGARTLTSREPRP